MELNISLGFFIFSVLLVTVFKSKFKGDIGELALALNVKDLDKNKYRKIHDIKLKNTSNHTKTSQIDHLIISTYGIFCIETKGYKGKIYGKEFSKDWVQYLSNQKNYFMNPVLQNYGHIKAVENILKNSYPNMKYFSIIAFSAEANLDSIEVKKAKICKISKVSDLIKDLSKDEILKKEDLDKIEILIKENKSYQSDFSHTRDIKKLKKENKEKIEKTICPRCGGKLVEKEGKYGKFIGCSNFPKCRFIYNKNKKK